MKRVQSGRQEEGEIGQYREREWQTQEEGIDVTQSQET